MDNLTHTLVGLMLSRAGLNQVSPRATGLLLLAANLPDIDSISRLAGTVRYLEYHRGLSHALVSIPVLALIPVALFRLFARRKPPWARAYLVSLIGVASHPLLDWTNVYGVRLLEPFSSAWLRADIFAIVDVWIWAALFLGVAAPAIGKLVSTEIGAKPGTGRSGAIFALGFLCLYGLFRYALHERAVATLDAHLYEGRAPLRVAAVPTPFNPFRWVGLAEGPHFYAVFRDWSLLEAFDPAAGRIYYKPEPGPEFERAAATDAFRVFLGFSQYPLWRLTPLAEPEGAKLVEAMDLRFGAPPNERFVASAVLDGSLRVVRAGFQFGGPPEYFFSNR
ncbi:MAG: metal-dependent hydrolase [Bryobacterales bacterium]|nr:metal-dependent hydrolase [Bryobacteraceae bacterium]MDW8355101.1 metal-dependent hydrolase [Bryobacterales bacterium]